MPLFALGLSWLAGCNAVPTTYRVRPGSAPLAARVAITQPDVEVREISAGGVLEKRDDWATTVSNNLVSAIASHTGFVPAPALDPEARKELADVAALFRAVSFNDLMYHGSPEPLNFTARPLDYRLGAIDHLADACHADTLLFVFARDAYSTGGRKALVVLGFAVPAPALLTAALVSRDGAVQWINFYFTQNTDLRSPDGARDAAMRVLAGLPRQ